MPHPNSVTIMLEDLRAGLKKERLVAKTAPQNKSTQKRVNDAIAYAITESCSRLESLLCMRENTATVLEVAQVSGLDWETTMLLDVSVGLITEG